MLTHGKQDIHCAARRQPIDVKEMIKISTQQEGQKLLPLRRLSSGTGRKQTKKKVPKGKGHSKRTQAATSSKELARASHARVAGGGKSQRKAHRAGVHIASPNHATPGSMVSHPLLATAHQGTPLCMQELLLLQQQQYHDHAPSQNACPSSRAGAIVTSSAGSNSTSGSLRKAQSVDPTPCSDAGGVADACMLPHALTHPDAPHADTSCAMEAASGPRRVVTNVRGNGEPCISASECTRPAAGANDAAHAPRASGPCAGATGSEPLEPEPSWLSRHGSGELHSVSVVRERGCDAPRVRLEDSSLSAVPQQHEAEDTRRSSSSSCMHTSEAPGSCADSHQSGSSRSGAEQLLLKAPGASPGPPEALAGVRGTKSPESVAYNSHLPAQMLEVQRHESPQQSIQPHSQQPGPITEAHATAQPENTPSPPFANERDGLPVAITRRSMQGQPMASNPALAALLPVVAQSALSGSEGVQDECSGSCEITRGGSLPDDAITAHQGDCYSTAASVDHAHLHGSYAASMAEVVTPSIPEEPVTSYNADRNLQDMQSNSVQPESSGAELDGGYQEPGCGSTTRAGHMPDNSRHEVALDVACITAAGEGISDDSVEPSTGCRAAVTNMSAQQDGMQSPPGTGQLCASGEAADDRSLGSYTHSAHSSDPYYLHDTRGEVGDETAAVDIDTVDVVNEVHDGTTVYASSDARPMYQQTLDSRSTSDCGAATVAVGPEGEVGCSGAMPTGGFATFNAHMAVIKGQIDALVHRYGRLEAEMKVLEQTSALMKPGA